jgi:hypothetical protein
MHKVNWSVIENIGIVAAICFLLYATDTGWWWLLLLFMNTTKE